MLSSFPETSFYETLHTIYPVGTTVCIPGCGTLCWWCFRDASSYGTTEPHSTHIINIFHSTNSKILNLILGDFWSEAEQFLPDYRNRCCRLITPIRFLGDLSDMLPFCCWLPVYKCLWVSVNTLAIGSITEMWEEWDECRHFAAIYRHADIRYNHVQAHSQRQTHASSQC